MKKLEIVDISTSEEVFSKEADEQDSDLSIPWRIIDNKNVQPVSPVDLVGDGRKMPTSSLSM